MAANVNQITELQTRRVVNCKGKEFSETCKKSFKSVTGFTLIPIMRDGNCFYESLILFAKIYNVPEAILPRNVMALRHKSYKFMIDHPNIYIHNNTVNIDDIIKNTAWSDPIFDYVTMVATDIFQINIVIYRAGRDKNNAYVDELSPIGSTHTYTARILHSGGNHYDLVVPNEHPKELMDLLSALSENHKQLIKLKQQYIEIVDKKALLDNGRLTKRERDGILRNIRIEGTIKEQLDEEDATEKSILEAIFMINRNRTAASPNNALNSVMRDINKMKFLTEANKDVLRRNARNTYTRKASNAAAAAKPASVENSELANAIKASMKTITNNQTRRNAAAAEKKDRQNKATNLSGKKKGPPIGILSKVKANELAEASARNEKGRRNLKIAAQQAHKNAENKARREQEAKNATKKKEINNQIRINKNLARKLQENNAAAAINPVRRNSRVASAAQNALAAHMTKKQLNAQKAAFYQFEILNNIQKTKK